MFFEDSDEESRSGERTLSHITQRSVNSSRMETPLKMSFQKKVKSVHVVGASLSSTQRSPVIAERLENGTAGRVVGRDASSRGSVYNSARERFVSDATSSDEEGSEEEDETASTVQTLQKWTSVRPHAHAINLDFGTAQRGARQHARPPARTTALLVHFSIFFRDIFSENKSHHSKHTHTHTHKCSFIHSQNCTN